MGTVKNLLVEYDMLTGKPTGKIVFEGKPASGITLPDAMALPVPGIAKGKVDPTAPTKGFVVIACSDENATPSGTFSGTFKLRHPHHGGIITAVI